MDRQHKYWNNAGTKGYGKTYYKNTSVEDYSLNTVWDGAILASDKIGISRKSSILELGCGDGMFAINRLAGKFRKIEAYDYAPSAIRAAIKANNSSNIRFRVKDVRKLNFSKREKFDAVFMLGILHHVKKETPEIIRRVSFVSPAVVVLEPNGDSPIRKAFELLLPSYRMAEEDSFRMDVLERIFSDSGYELVYKKYIMVVPWFTPSVLLPLMIKIEKFVQKFESLNWLNSTVVLGFKKRKVHGKK